MSKGSEALITPALLVWARKSAGLTAEAAAQKAHVAAEKLAAWEEGVEKPSIPQARLLAGAYKRPLAIFFLDQPPRDFKPMHDFRRLPAEEAIPFSPALLFQIRRAHQRRSMALELFEEMRGEFASLPFKVSVSDDPEAVAERVRRFMDLDPEEQTRWAKVPSDSLRRWRDRLEQKGFLVFQFSKVSLKEVRGFSINDVPLPVVALNKKDAYRGRLFTMMHEVTHILLQDGGICDLGGDAHHPPEERFCNHVAGAVLVPKAGLLQEPLVSSKRPGAEWTNEELDALVRKYGASREVLLRRLLIFRRVTDAFYKKKREEFRKEHEKVKEKPLKPPRIKPHVQALSQVGPTFARLVVEGYHDNRMTAVDVADFLDLKIIHLPLVEQVLLKEQVQRGGVP